MKYDLHTHTTCSDGKLTKLELLKRANELELEYISFTDHNYIEILSSQDINNQYTDYYNIDQQVIIIDGIEFDVYDYKGMHILGYNIQNKKAVYDKLEEVSKKNDLICQKILLNIYKYYNIFYSKQEILNFFHKKYLSKRLIIDWMVLKGHAKDYIESGNLFTNKKSPTYEKKCSLTSKEILNLISESGGISVLAHPSTIKASNDELEKIVINLKENGLLGIEVLNTSKTTLEDYIYFTYLAKKYNLIQTSGTDFHNYENYSEIGVENEISKKLIKKIRGDKK